MNEAELAEEEALRKTVTVATQTHLAADVVPLLYVGIGITRDALADWVSRNATPPNVDLALYPWHVLEASVAIVDKQGGETGDIYGADLMPLFRQGYAIGYQPTHGRYLVGHLDRLAEAGVVVPAKTMVATQIDHWFEIDRINLHGQTGGTAKMTNATAGKTAKEKVAKEPKAKVEKTQSACACGCGQMTGSNFAMGHDSKLRGQIHRVLEGREDPTVIPNIAYERLDHVDVMRFNQGTGSLEMVSVPECHFDHERGQKAAAEAQEKARKTAEKAAEKASEVPEPETVGAE